MKSLKTSCSSHPTSDLYDWFVEAYNHFNTDLFAEQPLPGCIITFQRKTKTMGYIKQNRWINISNCNKRIDELVINPEYWICSQTSDVLSTLVHQQCHIWQCRHGSPGRGGYHNREWADKMVSVGLIPSSTGLPGGAKTGDHVGEYIELGGSFYNSSKRFIERECRVPWLKIYPNTSQNTPRIFDADGIRYGADGKPYVKGSTDQKQLLLSGSRSKRLKETKTNSLESIIGRITNEQKRKLKYSCPTCGVNFWGKTGINAICIDCKKRFKAGG